MGVAVTPDGEIIVAGGFQGTVDFDPTDGVDEHTANGLLSAFVTRLAEDGTYLSTITFGGGSGEVGPGGGVALDSQGNLLLAGSFSYDVDFDPGPGYRWEWGSADVFVSKLTPEGSLLWLATFGSSAFDQGTGIAVDRDGNVLVRGTFRGTVDFDPTDGVDYHSSVGPYEDVFVTKLGSDGSYRWTRTYDRRRRYGVVVGPDGGVLIPGVFSEPVDFDQTSGGFVTKLNSDGSHAWTYAAEGDGTVIAPGVAVDALGNVLVTGEFRETVDFDPGPGLDLHTATFADDAFLTRLGPNGEYYWTRTFGSGRSSVRGKDLALDSQGGAFIVGFFTAPVDDPADFDSGCEVDPLASYDPGGSIIFISKLTCPELSADFDGDGRVDLWDFAQFQTCFTDPGPTTCNTGCSRLDLDPDDDIDLFDFTTFNAAITGPEISAPPIMSPKG